MDGVTQIGAGGTRPAPGRGERAAPGRRPRSARPGRARTPVLPVPGAALPVAAEPQQRAAPAPGRGARLDVLDIHLEAMVPLRILELRRVGEAERMRLAREAADQIAARGDNILFRAARRGATASAVSWLVTGLAVGAFQPGGIRFRSLAWCAAHLSRRWAEGETVCAACAAGLPPLPGPGA